LAGSVRIAGPEFSDARSRAAFARIEESIRQFTSHSRENIALIRNPLQIPGDHFVVLWSKGAAACSLIHQGGRVRGGLRDDWSQESADRSTSSEFENPLHQLAVARKELLAKFQTVLPTKRISSSVEPVGIDEPEVDPVLSVIAEQSGMGEAASRLAAFEHCTRGIVIFTAPIDKLKIEHIAESKEFVVIPIEQAVTRTIFHLPNLLRVIDFETSFFTPDEVARVADTLEEDATELAADRITSPPAAQKKAGKPKAPKGIAKWIAIGLALVATLALITFFSGDDPVTPPGQGPDSNQVKIQPKPKTESSILLILPAETQAFISPLKFETRNELLQAIGAGQGKRMFPQKEQIISYDSTEFAKGVYGYFKVEGSWRRGKLLQTLRSRDTVMIENFLPPLP
jgi:hypothetical protein